MKNVAVGVLTALVVVILAFSVSLAAVYRGLTDRQAGVEEAWASLAEVYRSELEVLPKIVRRAQGVAAAGGETYAAVETASRDMTEILTPQVIEEPARFDRFVASEAALKSSVSRLLAIVGEFPVLQSDQDLAMLRTQLETAANRLTVQRTRYNAAAVEFNSGLKGVPANWVARFYRFREKEYFRGLPEGQAASA